MGWGQLTGKLMPRLYSPSVVGFYERLWSADGARYLRDLVLHGYYGVLPPGDSYADDLPIRFIRSAEMNGDLDVDLDDCPFVEGQYYIQKARVQKDDVLLAVKGATIASRKCVAHVRNDVGKAIVNGSIYRMQVKPEVNPRFLAIVLSTEMLKRQMRLALTANNGVDYLDKTLIHHLVVPTPERWVQDKLVAIHDAAMATSISAKQEAAALLASIDDYLLSELGIALPPETENTLANRTFRVSAHELGGWRFDPHALHPDVEACREAIERFGKFAHLRKVASFSRDQVAGRQEPLPYVGLEHVQSRTGILLDAEFDNDFGTALVFEPGDVLFPKLRPYLNKVHLADVRGYCSTEFHVLRAKAMHAEFLALLLRSEITVRQTKHLMTGNTLPRLQTRDIQRLPVPVPNEAVQDRIVVFAARAQIDAAKLTQSATAELETAKREIETILLGGAA